MFRPLVDFLLLEGFDHAEILWPILFAPGARFPARRAGMLRDGIRDGNEGYHTPHRGVAVSDLGGGGGECVCIGLPVRIMLCHYIPAYYGNISQIYFMGIAGGCLLV